MTNESRNQIELQIASRVTQSYFRYRKIVLRMESSDVQLREGLGLL